MTPRRYRRREVLALAAAAGASACFPGTTEPSPTPTSTPLATIPAAPSGTIVVYSALDDELTGDVLAAFSKAVPTVRVEVGTIAAADEIETRLRVERATRRADVFLGGASAHHQALGADGFLDPFAGPAAAQIGSRFKDPSSLWTGWYEDVLGLAVNADRLRREGLARPASWDDLTTSAWRGRVVMPDPRHTDAGYAFVFAQYLRTGRDEAKTMDYCVALDANVAAYAPSAPDAVASVASGEAAAAPTWGRYALGRHAPAASVELLAPTGAIVEVGAASVVKGTGSPQAARALVDWAAGRDAQSLVSAVAGMTPTRALATPPTRSPSLAAIDPSAYDRRTAWEVRDRLLTRWRDATGHKD